VRIAIAVVAALCAGFCFALGSLIQQGAARQTHEQTLRFGLLVALVRQRRWLGGLALTVLAFGIQATALAFGPLALVQPLVAMEVLFALPMIAHRNRLPLRRKGVTGGLGVASGMAIFVAVSPPTGGVSVPGLAAWAPALAGITALAALSGSAGLRSRGTARVIWLAAATAVLYALVNAVTKSSVGLLMHQGAGVLATWEPYTLIGAGILSGLFGQSAFNAGPLSLSLPVIDTVEPVSSVILGAAVFGEHLARSPGLLALQLTGGAIAAAGIVVLSGSPITLAEERRESQSPGPQVGQASPPTDRPAGNKHHGSFGKIFISRTYRGFQMKRRTLARSTRPCPCTGRRRACANREGWACSPGSSRFSTGRRSWWPTSRLRRPRPRSGHC
jgi:hypothetical protein